MSDERAPGGPRLSVILITLNEEARLADALESVRWADEIVVVDSGSTDATERIARRHTDRFLVRDWPGYGPQKQRALEAATGEWVLSLDADEVVTPELADSIRRAIRRPEGHVGFLVERWNRRLGTWFWSRGWTRDRHLRLFRRDRGRFTPARVHERVVVDGPVGRLPGRLLHYSVRDIADHLDQINRHTTLAARGKHDRGVRSGALMPFIRGAAWFVKDYLLRAGFLHGGAGLLNAGLSAVYAFVRHAKIWELEHVEEAEDRGEDEPEKAERTGGGELERAEPRRGGDTGEVERPGGGAEAGGADAPDDRPGRPA